MEDCAHLGESDYGGQHYECCSPKCRATTDMKPSGGRCPRRQRHGKAKGWGYFTALAQAAGFGNFTPPHHPPWAVCVVVPSIVRALPATSAYYDQLSKNNWHVKKGNKGFPCVGQAFACQKAVWRRTVEDCGQGKNVAYASKGLYSRRSRRSKHAKRSLQKSSHFAIAMSCPTRKRYIKGGELYSTTSNTQFNGIVI
eukprot:903844-Amphidinium_carterae.1